MGWIRARIRLQEGLAGALQEGLAGACLRGKRESRQLTSFLMGLRGTGTSCSRLDGQAGTFVSAACDTTHSRGKGLVCLSLGKESRGFIGVLEEIGGNGMKGGSSK